MAFQQLPCLNSASACYIFYLYKLQNTKSIMIINFQNKNKFYIVYDCRVVLNLIPFISQNYIISVFVTQSPAKYPWVYVLHSIHKCVSSKVITYNPIKSKQTLKLTLLSQLKDLRIYNFYTPVSTAIQNLPSRYMYNEGILQDIDKLRFYAQRKGTNSIQSRISLFGENMFEDQIKNSCLILQNEIASEVESKQFQKERNDFPIQRDQEYDNINPNFSGTHSFQNNLSRNESLVAQMNLIYGRQINRQEYSEALKLFLKWVQYFNEHSFGGFLKTIYKSFCQSLYMLEKTQFQTLVDQVSIFVQYMVKVYTKIYALQQMNKSADGKLFKNQNVYNLIMSFMFRKTKIKSFIKTMVRENNQEKIKKFEQKLMLYRKKSIGHFNIEKKFILIRNQQRQEVLRKKQNNQQNTFPTKDMNVGTTSQQKQQQNKQLLQSFKSQLQSSCYQKSLRLISQLCSGNQAISPISRLKTIITIARTIQEQITNFYIHQLHLPKTQIPQLDPDNLTSIVIYLIVANNNTSLFEQLKMIEYFTTTNTLNCISGYYLNVFIAASETILDLNI